MDQIRKKRKHPTIIFNLVIFTRKKTNQKEYTGLPKPANKQTTVFPYFLSLITSPPLALILSLSLSRLTEPFSLLPKLKPRTQVFPSSFSSLVSKVANPR